MVRSVYTGLQNRVRAERPLGPNLCRLVKKKMRFTVTYNFLVI